MICLICIRPISRLKLSIDLFWSFLTQTGKKNLRIGVVFFFFFCRLLFIHHKGCNHLMQNELENICHVVATKMSIGQNKEKYLVTVEVYPMKIAD